MKSFGIWHYYILIIFILFLFLGIVYLYYSNKTIMKNKGYKDEYIKFMLKDLRQRVMGIGIGIPIILLASGLIVKLFYGKFDFGSEKEIFLFFILFIIFSIPFAWLDQYQTRKKYKKLAIETDTEIVVDLNFRLLHRIFNPMVELVSSLLFVGFFLVLDIDYHLAFNHVIILWLLYFTVRSMKFQVKPSLKDGYSYSFLFLTINHFILIFYLIRKTFKQDDLHILLLVSGLLLSLFLVLKSAYYIINFGLVKRELTKES